MQDKPRKATEGERRRHRRTQALLQCPFYARQPEETQRRLNMARRSQRVMLFALTALLFLAFCGILYEIIG